MKLRIKRTNYYCYGFWHTIDRNENTLQFQEENGSWTDVPKEAIEYVNLKMLERNI